MSSLINRIRRAMLGSAGDIKVRALLAELEVPAGGSGGSLRAVRNGFLRRTSDVSVLRNALADIGLNGEGGGGAQALSNVRVAVLKGKRAGETVLRDSLDDLLEPEDLSGGELLTLAGTPITTGSEYEHGIGSSYAGFTVTASGGTAPYTYSVASGSLPDGVTLDASTGVVSGTPAFESAGTYADIVLRVTDSLEATDDLAPFTITIAFKDPYYDDVTLLLDYDAPNNNAVITDQKFGDVATVTDAKHSTVVTPPYGTSSILLPGSGLALASSSKWDIGGSPFTIDCTFRMSTASGQPEFLVCVWDADPNFGWLFYKTGSEVASFIVSTTGSNVNVVVESGAIIPNVWARWRVDFDGTKYRIYKDGAMVGSGIAAHTAHAPAIPLTIGANASAGFPFTGNMRGIRLTKGSARTASDSGYTVSDRAFPTA